MKIAICDKIGLCYDGDTLKKSGLGGSESAVILMSKELSNLGFDVTVFNNCRDSSHSQPGTYDGVKYIDNNDAPSINEIFDVVIVSRTAEPFFNFTRYPFIKTAKTKVLWLHDTFCEADQYVEDLLIDGKIDYLFTLSDFHTDYVLNCDHGKKRNYEVLKRKVFQTRNGAVKYINDVDISKKDKNHFVYNSSVTKGLIPLIEHIWPKVKENIPDAHLTVIGGYYRFREGAEPDEQEKTLRKLVEDDRLKSLNITFTDVIPQSQIANILANANFMIYPGAFPETFGISTLESLLYNTPLITTRFGALEETAIEKACYLIDYAIEPNSLFPNINKNSQIDLFVNAVISAYDNTYLHQQKQNYCSVVKDVAGWDTVALQWKQFFYRISGNFLPVEEHQAVKRINEKVARIFGRVNTIPPSNEYSSSGLQNRIIVISPFYNAEKYIEKCIMSIAQQDYHNYAHYLIDDKSTDSSYSLAIKAITSLPTDLQSKFVVIKNEDNVGAVKNQVDWIKKQNSDSIIMLLDGDDWLINNNTIFHLYNDYYQNGAEFTYGSCWSLTDNIPLIAQDYPVEVKNSKSYRNHHFNWIIPYTHLRTFKKNLIDNIDESLFKDENNNWYKAGGDGSVFYALIEQAQPANVIAIKEVVYNYNDINPLNDYKVNGTEQNKNANRIANITGKSNLPEPKTQEIKAQMTKKKILIAVPTGKYVEPETFKSIYDLDVPEGYETEFQFFYGYRVDQIRNLIADWAKRYDYLLAVDSDIVLPKNTLRNFLAADKPIISGLYIQRIPDTHVLEVYMDTPNGGCTNIPYELIRDRGIVEIAACGFGCVLIKGEVFRAIPYPQFEYHSALNHRDTVSEDVDFAIKARNAGFKIWADSSIQCEHIGNTTFIVEDAQKKRFRELANQDLLPKVHYDYMTKLNIEPKVVYDIGACVTHWCSVARKVWPDSKYYLFEAMDGVGQIYEERGFKNYHLGVLSDESDKIVEFYQNTYHPGGNSYYRENPAVNPATLEYFNDDSKVKKNTQRLDDIITKNKWPLPDLIKIDVQGAELDVLKGANIALQYCNDIIIELQHREYNIGAPQYEIVIEYLKTKGFELISNFTRTNVDGDYHFRRFK